MSSKNVDSFAASTNPDIRRLLGIEGDMGKALGSTTNGLQRGQAGRQFGEIWDRSITPLGVPRGINSLWNKAGCNMRRPSADWGGSPPRRVHELHLMANAASIFGAAFSTLQAKDHCVAGRC